MFYAHTCSYICGFFLLFSILLLALFCLVLFCFPLAACLGHHFTSSDLPPWIFQRHGASLMDPTRSHWPDKSSWVASFVFCFLKVTVNLLFTYYKSRVWVASLEPVLLTVLRCLLPSKCEMSQKPLSSIYAAQFLLSSCHVKNCKVEPWLVWLSGLSTSLQTKGSPVQFLVRAHAWVEGQVPSGSHVRGNHTLTFLSLSFSLPSPLSKNK